MTRTQPVQPSSDRPIFMLRKRAKQPILDSMNFASVARTLTSTEAKDGFGHLIDLARQSPVTITKHQRPVVVVLAVEEFERLSAAATHHTKLLEMR